MPLVNFAYETIPPITWAYMSSLLMIALFFKFNRFWSVRNFDLLLLILLAPGLLMIERGRLGDSSGRFESRSQSVAPEFPPSRPRALHESESPPVNGQIGSDGNQENGAEKLPTAGQDESLLHEASPWEVPDSELANSRSLSLTGGQKLQRWGYIWLFSVGGLFMCRMLTDGNLVRKPVLEPNLTTSGLIFLGISLMFFLFANIIITKPTPSDLHGARNALKLLQRQAADETDVQQLHREGPGYWLFNLFPVISTFNSGNEILQTNPDEAEQLSRYVTAAKSLAIISQLMIVLSLVFFCYWNFGSFSIGAGVATIYLMLPYTAIYTGYALHALPAALILLALLSFRIPWLAGIIIGLATGVSYYPIFLLPLWGSFYWERGFRSFMIGVGVSLAVCIAGLAFTSPDFGFFVHQVRAMFGFLLPRVEGLEGVWSLGWSSWYRMPLIVAHGALAVSFVAWPMEKNIGTLISCSAAIMIAVQFWLGFDGGLTMAWYLPLVLLTFFRPNLSGRTAPVELIRKKRQDEGGAELLV